MLRAILLVFMLAPGTALPQQQQRPPEREAVVANETDRALQELYLSAPGAEAGPDRLGANVLPPRASIRIALGRTRECVFEARAVFADGEEMRRRVDVCRNRRVAFADTGPRREVEVVNGADQELRELYLMPPGARDRGRDRLGSGTVPAGESVRLRLRGPAAECVFDVRAVFADNSEQGRSRVDLCRTPRLALGDTDAQPREVTLGNRDRRALREFYARRAGAAEAGWGADRLGPETVAPGGEFRLRLRVAAGGCAYDLRAVFEDDREEVQPAVDLCATPTVAFGTAAPAGQARGVTLVNAFARIIQEAYLSPAESDAWGPDALGAAVLEGGARQRVEMRGGCLADLRIVFDNRSAEERRGIDICATPAVLLRPGWTVEDKLAGEAAPGGRVRLRNGAAVPVVALHADPPGAPRGADRLGQAVLAAGDTLDFAPPAELGADRCRADLAVVFGDGRELRLPDLDLCGGEELVLQ